MNSDTLLEHFERIIEAPDAIVQLRRFILDLAVRGKLVPQDPNEEPADVLISQIATERKRRADAGELVRDQVPCATINGGFPIPKSWCWARLGFVTNVVMGQSPPGETYNTEGNGVPLINGPAEFSEGAFGITVVNQYTTMPTKFCKENDLLLCVRGSTTGRTNIAGFDACIGRGVAAIQSLYSDNFVRLFVWSWRDRIIEMGRGIAFPSISRQQIEDLAIPLPPLAEQQRIVANVDKLMALCDELEVAKTEREQTRDRLVSASLYYLNPPAEDDEEAVTSKPLRDHARFVLTNLPRLTTRTAHIKQLRQTILSLAVRGKLVPQDPNDEPASELLKRIQVEKARLGRNHQVTKAKIDAHEQSFSLPEGWVWTSLGEIMISRDSERVPISKEERNIRAKIYDYYGASGVIDKIDRYLFDEPLLLIGEDGANLINRSTPIAFIARGKYWVNNHAHVLSGISENFLRFLKLHINAIDLKPYVTGTAQPKMNQAKMNSIPISLPPLAEQERIVAKVDELMDLCDQLEVQITNAESDSRRLLEAVLHEALQPALEEALA